MKKRIAFTCYVTILVDEDQEDVQQYDHHIELIGEIVKHEFNPQFPPIVNRGVEVEEMFYDSIEVLPQ